MGSIRRLKWKFRHYLRRNRTPILIFVIGMVAIVGLSIGALDEPETPKVSEIEGEIHDLVNLQREANGLHPLESHDGIRNVALSHSQDMSERDFYSHISPDGVGPDERLRESGIYCGPTGEFVGENIHIVPLNERIEGYHGDTIVLETSSDIAQYVVGSWMDSEGHRDNILHPDFRLQGVGVYIDKSSEEVYITQKMCG